MRELGTKIYVVVFLTACVFVASTASALTAQEGSDLPRGVPYASNTDPVRFVSVLVSSQAVRRGEPVRALVVTSSNAAAVTAQTGTFRVLLSKSAPGIFQGAQDIPWWAPPGSHTVTFTAIRTDGVTAEYAILIDVR